MMDLSSSNSDISLAKKCLELCSTLADKDCNFSFQLRLGTGLNFSLKSGTSDAPKAKTKRSPSYLKRQHRRHQDYLKKKTGTPPDCVDEDKRHIQPDKGCQLVPGPNPPSQPPTRSPPPPIPPVPPPPPPLPPSSARPSRLIKVIGRSDSNRASFQQLDGGGENEVKGGEHGGEETTGPGEVNHQVLTDTEADFEGDESEYSDIDWEEIDRQYEERRLPGQSYEDFLKTVPRIAKLNKYQSDEDCDSDY